MGAFSLEASVLGGIPCLTLTESLNLRLTLWAYTLQPPVIRICSSHMDLSSTHFSPDFCSHFSYQLRASSILSAPTICLLEYPSQW